MSASVDSLIRDALRVSDSPNPADAAEAAFRKIPRADYGEYLLALMRIRASSLTSTDRTAAVRGITRPFRSRKNDQIRDAWQQWLRASVLVDGAWMVIGDMSAEQCRAVAVQRQADAAELLAQADGFNRIAAILDARGVEKVSDLSQSDASDLIMAVAA